MDVAVAGAAPPDVAEQRGGFAFAGQAGELVDGGDDERRCQPVDLLVDGQDRQALADLRRLWRTGSAPARRRNRRTPAAPWRRP